MPTTSFPGNTTGISWLGEWSSSTQAGETTWNRTGSSSIMRAGWVGTDLEIRMYGPASPYTYWVSIDGGAEVSYNTTAGQNWVLVATGLADTAHTVSIRSNTTTSFLYISYANTLRVTGAAPAVQYRPGYGPLIDVNSPYVTQTGNPKTTTTAGYSAGRILWWEASWASPNSYNGGGVRFVADCTDIWCWAYEFGSSGNPTKWALIQDGVLLGITSSTNANQYGLFQLGTGLSGTHTYEIINVWSATSGHQWGYLTQVMLGGGTGIVASTPAARPLTAFFGDSIALEKDGTANGTLGRAFKTTQALGHECLKLGKNAETWTWGKANTGNVTGGTKKPKTVFVCLGANEIINNTSIVTMEADAVITLNNLLTGLDSDALIFVEGVFDSTWPGMSLRRTSYNAAIASAVATVNNPRCTFLNTDGVINPATDTADTLHPNSAGYTKISAFEVAAYQAATATGAKRRLVNGGLVGTSPLIQLGA